jgi:hypothetical protein
MATKSVAIAVTALLLLASLAASYARELPSPRASYDGARPGLKAVLQSTTTGSAER